MELDIQVIKQPLESSMYADYNGCIGFVQTYRYGEINVDEDKSRKYNKSCIYPLHHRSPVSHIHSS